MPDLLRVATAMSATLAAIGAWRGRRTALWATYWPVPLMVFAAALSVRDVVVLAGGRPTRVPALQLGLGVWAGLTAIIAGTMEVSAGRRGGPAGRRLIAAALLVASGATLLLYQTSALSSPNPAGVASGILILVAGVLLAVARSGARTVPALHLLWPAAMLAGALTYQCPPPDALVDARRELSLVLTALVREGAKVIEVKMPPGAPHFVRGPVRTFSVDRNEVQVYLVAHDDDLRPEAHLFPRAQVPPPIEGVSHLHSGPHILVVCITADPGFVRQLDRIVHDLGGPSRLRLFVFAKSAPG